MQKKLIALAVAGLVSGGAFAQSNVQVYGIIDAGYANVNFGNGSTSRIQGSGQKTERLGFQGSEDLGGGMKANFRLELGYNTDTGNLDNGNAALGNPAQLFQREARVGLEGASWGQVNFGRQYTPIFNIQAAADVFNVAGIGSNYTLTNTGMTRMSNSVKYNSPNMSGFTFALGYGFGDAGTANTPANGGASGESLAGPKDAGRHTGFNAMYANGPLTLLGAYGKTLSAPGLGLTTVGTKATVIGGAYDFKVVKLVAGYETAKNDPATLDVKGYLFSAVAPVGSDFLKASFTSLEDKNKTAASASKGKSSLLAIGWVHPFSKRTSLYGHYARMTNDAVAARSFLAQTGGGANPLSAAAGFDASGFQAGVTHEF